MQLSRGNFPTWELPGGDSPGANCPLWELPRGQLSYVAIALEAIVQGGIVLFPRSRMEKG